MATQALPTRDDFAAMLDEMFGGADSFEGRVVHGTVTAIENDMAVIDVGSEVRRPRAAARIRRCRARRPTSRSVTKSKCIVDRVENVHGEAMLSRDRARREAAWDTLETEFAKTARVEGVIFGRVKGGFTVDLNGAVAFLPGSQVDIRPVRDVTPLMDIPQPFQILKMDRKRGNIVVSRRADPGRDPRRAAFGPHPQPRRGPDHRRRRQEHHRLRCVRRPGRHRRPAARHRSQLQARRPSERKF